MSLYLYTQEGVLDYLEISDVRTLNKRIQSARSRGTTPIKKICGVDYYDVSCILDKVKDTDSNEKINENQSKTLEEWSNKKATVNKVQLHLNFS